MGDTFGWNRWSFRGYALEIYIGGSSKRAFRKTGIAGPKFLCPMLPSFWYQPKNRLQVEAPVFGVGKTWFAQSATTSDNAKTHVASVVEMHKSAPSSSPALGCPEDSATFATNAPATKGSGGAHDYPVAAALETDWPAAAAFLARPAGSATGPDRAQTFQPSLDSRFQRLVQNRRRQAGGATDRARPVQSLHSGDPVVARSAMVACAHGIRQAFCLLRQTHGDPGGQWFWLDWAGRAFAVERLVDSPGYPGRIHCAGTSRTEWGTRADASGVQSRFDRSGIQHGTSPTTAERALGAHLQPSTATRSSATEDARGTLPAGPTRVLPACAQVEISQAMGGATGSEQWANPLAGTLALCRGSIRWHADWTAACGARKTKCVSGQGSLGGTAAGRSRWHPTGKIHTPTSANLKKCNLCSGLIVLPMLWPCAHPNPLPRWGRGDWHQWFSYFHIRPRFFVRKSEPKGDRR
jgi:hypothetical protein